MQVFRQLCLPAGKNGGTCREDGRCECDFYSQYYVGPNCEAEGYCPTGGSWSHPGGYIPGPWVPEFLLSPLNARFLCGDFLLEYVYYVYSTSSEY